MWPISNWKKCLLRYITCCWKSWMPTACMLSLFFRIGQFLGANSIWRQQFLGKKNSDFIENYNNILRFCVIERCCGNKNTAPNQSFTRVSDIFKIHAIASSPRKERSVSAKELAIYDFTHSTRLPWEIGLERVWKNKCGSGNKYQINVKYGSGIGAQRFLNMWLLQRQIFHGYRIFQHL